MNHLLEGEDAEDAEEENPHHLEDGEDVNLVVQEDVAVVEKLDCFQSSYGIAMNLN
ncbi:MULTISPECIES: hypothetical protein [Bacillus]|uniref:hypothetical protein n=1 Tax=Bacillus TaxID=1386 RepID=UPI00031A4DFC|nr:MULTISPECIES: hypothetical protein [Bacillus]